MEFEEGVMEEGMMEEGSIEASSESYNSAERFNEAQESVARGEESIQEAQIAQKRVLM